MSSTFDNYKNARSALIAAEEEVNVLHAAFSKVVAMLNAPIEQPVTDTFHEAPRAIVIDDADKVSAEAVRRALEKRRRAATKAQEAWDALPDDERRILPKAPV